MPWTTLIRSYTTRRSAPRTRSRLRRPTSKSTTTTFCPASASAAPRAAVDVVFPTPPFPDVTTRTLAIFVTSSFVTAELVPVSVHLQPSPDRLTSKLLRHFAGLSIRAVDLQNLAFLLRDPSVR